MSTQEIEQQQSRLKELIAKGKEQGFVTYAEVNDHLPDDIADPDQIEDIIRMINDMGITVYETAPDPDELLATEESTADELAAEEAAAALALVETEAGRTTDPVRMYMREMGTVELLTREGEITIAKRSIHCQDFTVTDMTHRSRLSDLMSVNSQCDIDVHDLTRFGIRQILRSRPHCLSTRSPFHRGNCRPEAATAK